MPYVGQCHFVEMDWTAALTAQLDAQHRNQRSRPTSAWPACNECRHHEQDDLQKSLRPVALSSNIATYAKILQLQRRASLNSATTFSHEPMDFSLFAKCRNSQIPRRCTKTGRGASMSQLASPSPAVRSPSSLIQNSFLARCSLLPRASESACMNCAPLRTLCRTPAGQAPLMGGPQPRKDS